MWKYFVQDISAVATDFLELPRIETVPVRRIAVDAALLLLFLLTSSWLVKW